MGDFLKDLWGFMRDRKKFWLAPLIIVLLLVGVLLIVVEFSVVAPFIYTLF
jgi:competence protein ComGC